MNTRQAEDLRMEFEAVPSARDVGVLWNQRKSAVQYRYLVERAGIVNTLEYVEVHRGFLHTSVQLCRGLSASCLWVAMWLSDTADLLAATDERRRRAGYE